MYTNVPDTTILAAANDSETSNLNPEAPAFVPAWKTPEIQAQEAEMMQNGHYATITDEMQPLPSAWVAHNAYVETQAVYLEEQQMAYWLQQEDMMRSRLYTRPQQPKGNTYGRARSQQVHTY